MNVADQVKEPSKRYSSLLRLCISASYAPIFFECRHDVSATGWLRLNVRWLASWFEWDVDVVPRSTVLGLVIGADIVRPSRCQHEQHDVGFSTGPPAGTELAARTLEVKASMP